MKLIFAFLDVSITMALTRCYKTEGFFAFIKYSDDSIGLLRFRYDTHTMLKKCRDIDIDMI